MRSRYSAYVMKHEDYLLATWHPSTRPAISGWPRSIRRPAGSASASSAMRATATAPWWNSSPACATAAAAPSACTRSVASCVRMDAGTTSTASSRTDRAAIPYLRSRPPRAVQARRQRTTFRLAKECTAGAARARHRCRCCRQAAASLRREGCASRAARVAPAAAAQCMSQRAKLRRRACRKRFGQLAARCAPIRAPRPAAPGSASSSRAGHASARHRPAPASRRRRCRRCASPCSPPSQTSRARNCVRQPGSGCQQLERRRGCAAGAATARTRAGAPDHLVEARNGQSGQRHRHLVARTHVQPPPARERAQAHPLHAVIVQHHRFELQHHGDAAASPAAEVHPANRRQRAGGRIFPGHRPVRRRRAPARCSRAAAPGAAPCHRRRTACAWRYQRSRQCCTSASAVHRLGQRGAGGEAHRTQPLQTCRHVGRPAGPVPDEQSDLCRGRLVQRVARQRAGHPGTRIGAAIACLHVAGQPPHQFALQHHPRRGAGQRFGMAGIRRACAVQSDPRVPSPRLTASRSTPLR